MLIWLAVLPVTAVPETVQPVALRVTRSMLLEPVSSAAVKAMLGATGTVVGITSRGR